MADVRKEERKRGRKKQTGNRRREQVFALCPLEKGRNKIKKKEKKQRVICLC